MAPMLEDEIMHDTEKMNSKVVGLARTGKQIYDFIEQLKRAKSTEAQAITDNGLPFSFSGQITDLSYFNNNEILPKEVIENIPDAELKEAVISNLELAEKQGLINVNLDSGNITLTDSGREYISNPNFISAANINKAHSAIRAMEIQHGLESDTVRYGVTLEGTDRDLQFFRFASNLDLEEVTLSPDKKAALQVMENISKWEKDGLIQYNSENTSISLTKLGQKKLYSDLADGVDMIDESVITPKNLSAGRLSNVSGVTAQTTSQAAAQATQVTATAATQATTAGATQAATTATTATATAASSAVPVAGAVVVTTKSYQIRLKNIRCDNSQIRRFFMKKAFRKITKVISITTTILLSNVLLAYSAFAEGGIGNAPSSVDTATYDTLVTLVFWVVRIVVLGLTAIPGLIKIAQGIGNEDVRERNGGISLMVIGGALFAATFAIEALF